VRRLTCLHIGTHPDWESDDAGPTFGGYGPPCRSIGEPSRSNAKPLSTFSGCVLIVACLYWGQAILIPIALAALITFLLGPIVSALRRLGLSQTPAVLRVVRQRARHSIVRQTIRIGDGE
jgi:hypothetical protein